MYKIVKIPKNTTITVIGDVYNQEHLLNELINKIKPSSTNLLVSVGNLNKDLYKYFDNDYSYVVRGNSEQGDIFSNEASYPSYLSISFIFDNQIKITVVHGGISFCHTEQDFGSNIEIVYLSYIDSKGKFIPVKYENDIIKPIYKGKLWHEVYDGSFGYVISGNNVYRDSEIRSYPHSCNIDTSCDKTGVLSAIKYSEHRREEIIQVSKS